MQKINIFNKKISKISLFLVSFFIFGVLGVEAANFSYPVPIISKPNCRFDEFSTLGSDCKQNLPVLKTSDYNNKKDDYDLRRIYTVLWGATYTYGWDVGSGSHLGVDIATSKGTPVVSMADGTVTYAGAKTGWGNIVTVKHTVNGKTIYSNYAHLSKITVKYGDKVNAGNKIGEVGSTGNSTGNHLHFQIDTNSGDKSHPYYYFQNCPGNEWNVVNTGGCSSDMKDNTIDPLLFLETNGAVIKGGVIDKEKVEKIEKVEQKNLITVKQVLEREVKDFLRRYKVSFVYDSPTGNIPLGGTTKIHITITRKHNGKAFTGNLPDFMKFLLNDNMVKIFPEKLRVLDGGKRDIQLTGLKTGITTLYIKIGTVLVTSKRLNVYNPKVKAKVESVNLRTNTSVYLGEEKKGFAIFMDKNNVPLVDLPYSGEYRMTTENAYICPFNYNTNNPDSEFKKECSLGAYKEDLKLTYNTTFKGVPIFGIKSNNKDKNIIIKIYDNLKRKVLAEKNIRVKNPKDIDYWYTYKEEVLDVLEKGIVDGVSKGYFSENRTLEKKSALRWIRNFLIYKINNLESGVEKNKYIEKLKEINDKTGSKYDYLTRMDMLNLINQYIPKNYKTNAIKYRDLTQEESVIANKIFTKDYTWKDEFGAKYFQPDQNLTRGEAAYMLYQALF
ncbi:MAG: M23 family metallopeptidase [Candidatus Gracilibacteria bacterium]|nr:M23 family metallopeptidase [Candidatus Gracilibacteria bacterium]